MNNSKKQKLSRKKNLLTEGILSVVAILAISFLPTLHLYVSNPNDLKLTDLMSSVYLFTGIGVALFVILRLSLRRRPFMAGGLTTLIMFLLVNFTLLSEPLKLFIHNYVLANAVALLVMVLLIVGAWFLLRRLCADVQLGQSILTVFTIVFVGLVAFNGIQLIFSHSAAATQKTAEAANQTPAPVATPSPQPTIGPTVFLTVEAKNDTFAPSLTPVPNALPVTEAAPEPTATPEPTVTPEPKATAEPTPFTLDNPNIYLLLFDEYASMGAMEKYYGYNCDPMREFMRSVGINWSEHSYSMTNETKYSLTDLNMMDYVAYGKSSSKLSSLRKNSTIKKVFNEQLGYELYQYSQKSTMFGFMASLRDKKNRASYQKTTMDGVESDNIVKNQSILGAFESIFGSLTPQSQITGDSESLQKYGYYSSAEITSSSAFKKHTYHSDIKQILDIFDFYEDENNFKGSTKRAIFSHIKCPHAPFYFDQYGQVRPFSQRLNWNKLELYRDQYIFITKHMVNIFKTIISSDPNSIIIILSDHGVRSHNQGFCTISPKDNCWIFQSIYFCGQPLDIEGMSTVNLLRLIATKLGVNMPPVEDYVTVNSADDLSDVVYPR